MNAQFQGGTRLLGEGSAQFVMIEGIECAHDPLRDDQVEDQRQRVHSISLLLYFINFISNRNTRPLKKSLLHFLATSLAGAQQLLNSGA